MDVFSTGDVAKITRTSIHTVIRWIDGGLLKGWKVPGSKFRRVSRSDLRSFMLSHNLKIDLLEKSEGVILLISDDAALRATAASLLVCERKVRCSAIFEAGMIFQGLDPCAVIIDCELGVDTARKVANSVQVIDPDKPIVAITSSDGSGLDFLPCVSRAEISQGLSAILPPLLESA